MNNKQDTKHIDPLDIDEAVFIEEPKSIDDILADAYSRAGEIPDKWPLPEHKEKEKTL